MNELNSGGGTEQADGAGAEGDAAAGGARAADG
jgi:hypothetical protein